MSKQPHHPSQCGPEPHLHTLTGPTLAAPGVRVIMVDHVAVAMCDVLVADRLLQLILEHGLLAVPDSMPAAAWPPPTGAPRAHGVADTQ